MTPKSGLRLKGDVGVLFGDGGKQTVSRQYWINNASGLVNDVPGKADLDSKSLGNLYSAVTSDYPRTRHTAKPLCHFARRPRRFAPLLAHPQSGFAVLPRGGKNTRGYREKRPFPEHPAPAKLRQNESIQPSESTISDLLIYACGGLAADELE